MSDPRRGIAVILVLCVLAALLMLGLPFLFSQTGSRAGARQIAQHGQAVLGRDAAEGEAIAAGLQLLPDAAARAHDLGRDPARAERESANRYRVRLPGDLASGRVHAARAGAVIEDESGKLDPNSMGADSWSRLLAAVGIADYLEQWTFVWSNPNDASATQPGEWRSSRSVGQLATTLARCGLFAPETGLRVVDLDQLLACDPARFSNAFANLPPDPFQGRQAPAGQPASQYLRLPLTRAELDLLRPHLSVSVPGPGRAGMADGGTVVHYDRTFNAYTVDDPREVRAIDAWWVSERVGANARGKPERGVVWGDRLLTNGNTFANAGEGFGLMVPVPVNPNHATDAVLAAIAQPQPTAYDSLSDISVFARTNPTWLVVADGQPIGAGRMHSPEHTNTPPVVTIESFGAGLDAAGRRTAGEGQRTIIQLADQVRGARAAWSTQADWQALQHQRFAPAMVTAPKSYQRSMEVRARPGALSGSGHLIAGPQPGHVRQGAANPRADWVVGFGDLDAIPEADAGKSEQQDDAPGWFPAVLEPDGARPAGLLAYRIRARATANHALAARSSGRGLDSSAMRGRWVSLQVRFSDPGRAVTLFGSRVAPGSDTLGAEVTGVRGDADSQHRIELIYDPAGPGGAMLRLHVANGAIPHTGDEPGPRQTGWDDPGTAAFDESALGAGAPTSGAFAPADPVRAVELRTRFQPEADRWYHLLVCLSHDQPGGLGILVDGVAGRPWHRTGQFDRPGDWVHIPSLRLETALAASDPRTTTGALLVPGDRLQVSVPPGTTIDELLPPRGLIRVGNEYISYGRRSGANLSWLQRARRIDTNLTNPARAWPRTQAHARGDLVVPGWHRIEVGDATWFTGEASLQDVLASGDTQTRYSQPQLGPASWLTTPADFPGAYDRDADLTPGVRVDHLRYRTWAWLRRGQFSTTRAGTVVELRPTLTIADARGTWPRRGQVRFFMTGTADAYASEIGSAWFTSPGGTPTSLAFPAVTAPTFLRTVPDGFAVFAVVCSIGLDTVAGLPTGTDPYRLVQVEASDGRVEWVGYDDAVTPRDVPGDYLVQAQGFPFIPSDTRATARGSMRTAFAGRAELAARAPAPFPAGARVLPVQGRIAAQDGLVPGDIVTVMPMGEWASATRPVQVAVRMVATDGYPMGPMPSPGTDTYNFLFTLTDPVPATMPRGPVMFATGRGWSPGDTLSPVGQMGIARFGSFPRLEAMSGGFVADGGGDGRFTLGPDRERGGLGDGGSLRFDASGAGSLPGDGHRPAGIGITAVRTGAGGPALLSISRSLAPPFVIEANEPIFASDYGLLWVDGEVMAYHHQPGGNGLTQIIGRGLMGTEPLDHQIATIAGTPSLPIPAWPIPWGAVGVVSGAGIPAPSTLPQRCEVAGMTLINSLANIGQACWVVASPDGQQVEALRLYPMTNGRGANGRINHEWRDAPWLRGMYGTTAQAWSDGGIGNQPIMIAWYPRHQSALPASLPGDPGVLSAMLRSRRYQWAGVHLHRHGMRLDIGQGGHELSVLRTAMGIGLGLRSEIRGLAVPVGAPPADWFDWARRSEPLQPSGGDWTTVNGELMGAEWRVHARYERTGAGSGPQAWTDLAAAAAPQLAVDRAQVRAGAPIRVLATEPLR